MIDLVIDKTRAVLSAITAGNGADVNPEVEIIDEPEIVTIEPNLSTGETPRSVDRLVDLRDDIAENTK